MELKDEIRIAAPRPRVYAALNDPEILRQAIPGCEHLEKLSDSEFDAVVTSKVGPLTAKLKGAIQLHDLDPPVGYTLRGEGKGGASGFAKIQAQVRLAEDGPGTLLRYDVKAQVGGKLGQLGGAIIDRTARKLAGEFFQRLETLVGAPEAGEPVAARAPSAVPRVAVWAAVAAAVVALAFAAWWLGG